MKKKKHVRKSPFSPKSSKGISKVLIIAVVAIVLAGLGGMYILGQNGVKVGMTSIVKAPLNPNCELKDPELCKFMNNWTTQKNYSVTSSSKMEGMTIESLYEIDGDDKYHMLSKQNGKEQSNMISIGDTMYTLDYTDNKWWKQTFKATDDQTAPEKEVKEQFSFDEEEMKDNTKYKFITKESCGNLTCFKYELISPDMADIKQFMWFDDSDYLMRKMLVEDKVNGSSESIYSYGGVSIKEPSPIKEGEAGAMGSGYSQEEVEKAMQQYQQAADAYEDQAMTDEELDY